MLKYSFTGGRPDPASFPVEGLIDAAGRALSRMGRDLTLYPGDLGYRPLREIASQRFEKREGKPLPVDRLALTSGSMQAIDLVALAILKPGDIVLTEELCYSGTLSCFRHHQAQIVGIPQDERDGMDMAALEATLKKLWSQGQKPSFLYTTDTHQNPTGAIMTEDRRNRLLELADEYDLLIVEDDCYGDIDFEPGCVPPSLFSLDTQDRVVFIASFSKILGPGVRSGYYCAPQHILSETLKHRWDLGVSALSSCLLAEFFEKNLWEHIAQTTAVVKAKRDAMLETLAQELDDIARWTTPCGGLFIWVHLPPSVDLERLQQLAREQGVEFSLGRAFHARNEDIPNLRLSFGYTPIEGIREGTRRLCQCVRECV